MGVKVFFLLCVEAVIAQNAYSQCNDRGFPGSYGLGWNYDDLPYDGMGLAPFDSYGCVGALDNFGFSPFDSTYGPGWPNGFSGLGSVTSGPVFPGPLYGGGLPQASGYSIPPASISVLSENYIDGTVSVVGQLPFIASVSMLGEFPTAGSGAVSYDCGNGDVRIFGESAIAPSFMPAAPIIDSIDYNGLYSYGTAFVEDYRVPMPYTGCSYDPVY